MRAQTGEAKRATRPMSCFDFSPVRIVRGDTETLGVQWTNQTNVIVCEGYDIHPCKNLQGAVILPIDLPPIPSRAYEELEASVGGVGKHIRWKVLRNVSKTNCTRVQVVLHGNFHATQRELLTTLVDKGHVSYVPDEPGAFLEDKELPGNYFCIVAITNDSCTLSVAQLADVGLQCASMQQEVLREVQVSPERIDRAHHQWLRQFTHREPSEIGPLRCPDNWKQDFLPPSWVRAYTWHDVCNVIIADIGEDATIDVLSELPSRLARSLRVELQKRVSARVEFESHRVSECCKNSRRERARAYAIAQSVGAPSLHRDAVEDCDFEWMVLDRMREDVLADRRRLASLGHVSGNAQIGTSLTRAQNKQLLTCWYLSSYSAASDGSKDVMEACRLVLFRAFLHGWFVRVIGQYERTGKHIGFGTSVRTFGATSQLYESHKQTSCVQNRVSGRGGRLRGIAPLLLQARRARLSRRAPWVSRPPSARAVGGRVVKYAHAAPHGGVTKGV